MRWAGLGCTPSTEGVVVMPELISMHSMTVLQTLGPQDLEEKNKLDQVIRVFFDNRQV